jgi:hypothetical protein
MNLVQHLPDAEFLQSFENCSLSSDAWNHRAHLRIAYLYAWQRPFPAALARIRRGIQAFNAVTNTPEALDRGYHETITVAFVRLVYACLACQADFPNSDAFCDRFPQLLDKKVLLRFYSRERIMTLDAKQEFVEPDLATLPEIWPEMPQ